MILSSRIVVLALAVLATGAAGAWDAGHAAARGTWYAAGMASTRYQLPSEEGEDLFVLNLAPRVLFFPLDGFGLGAGAGFAFISHYTTEREIDVGPRAAYYLRRSPWMPYAGLSFEYVHNSMAQVSGIDAETGWQLGAAIGVSPVVGSHGTLPVELSYTFRSLTRPTPEGSENARVSTLGLEVGLGFFLGRGK